MPEPPTIAADGEKAVLVRASALARVAQNGRFGADKGVPGIELSVRHPASIVTVIARKGAAGRLADVLHGLDGCNVYWAGFEQYYVVAQGRAEGSLFRELKEILVIWLQFQNKATAASSHKWPGRNRVACWQKAPPLICTRRRSRSAEAP